MKPIASIIIACRNESWKLAKTLSSIRSTVTGYIEVIVINDASDDSYDYESCCAKYSAKISVNKIQMGVAQSRMIGAKISTSDILIFIDAHMKFPKTDWLDKIINQIAAEPRALYCTATYALNTNWTRDNGHMLGYGAKFVFFSDIATPHLNYEWIVSPTTAVMNIPCVMGACYAIEKKYFEYIDGFNGLQNWGGDEQMLSLKIFLEGGQCYCLTDIEIGHLFQEKPQKNRDICNTIFNCYAITYVTLPVAFHRNMLISLRSHQYVREIMAMINLNRETLMEARKRITNIIKNRSYEDFINFNFKM